MKGIQVYSNKGPGPLQRGDNHKSVKIGWGNLKIFSRTTGPRLTRLGTNYPWGRGFKFVPRGDNSERVKIHRIFFPPEQA
jgi:hypothetical protein